MKAVKTERAQELWQQLLTQNPTNDDLRYIIEYVEPLREQVQKLVKRSKKEILEEMKRL